MPDFRIAESAAEHRKLRAAGLPAAGLWSLAGAWAMRELTDGWVPAYWVASWPGGMKHARTLVSVGLWYAEERDRIPGYVFHDWPDYQRSAEQVEHERQRARDRMAAVRAAAKGKPPPGSSSDERSDECSGEHQTNFGRSSNARSPNVHDSQSLSLDRDCSNEQSRGARNARPRGTRLPADFRVTDAMRSWAATNAPGVDVDYETEKFIDYWRGQSGSRASKRDWTATWRNWLRKAREDVDREQKRAAQRRSTGQMSTGDERVSQLLSRLPDQEESDATPPQMRVLPGGSA